MFHMKKIILTLLVMVGFIITANAQAQNRSIRTQRKIERRMEMRHIRRMERRRHRRHRTVSEIVPTAVQRSTAVLFKEEGTSII